MCCSSINTHLADLNELVLDLSSSDIELEGGPVSPPLPPPPPHTHTHTPGAKRQCFTIKR